MSAKELPANASETRGTEVDLKPPHCWRSATAKRSGSSVTEQAGSMLWCTVTSADASNRPMTSAASVLLVRQTMRARWHDALRADAGIGTSGSRSLEVPRNAAALDARGGPVSRKRPPHRSRRQRKAHFRADSTRVRTTLAG